MVVSHHKHQCQSNKEETFTIDTNQNEKSSCTYDDNETVDKQRRRKEQRDEHSFVIKILLS